VEIWEEEKGMVTILPPNGYPDPDSNKTKRNYTKEPNEDHKNILKRRDSTSN
jgi:hypothetical protein